MRSLALNVIAAAGTGVSEDRIGGTMPTASATANTTPIATVAYQSMSMRLS